MKSKFLVGALFALPGLLLLGLFLSHKDLPVEDEATNVNPEYVELEKNWLTHHFTPLYSATNLNEKVETTDIQLIDCEEIKPELPHLREALVGVLQSICSDTVTDYMDKRTKGKSFTINSNVTGYQMHLLRGRFGVQDLPDNAEDVHRMYWEKRMEQGKNASLWEAVSWEGSWIKCQKMNKIDIFTTPPSYSEFLLSSKVPNCGLIEYTSSFLYSPTVEEVFAEDKQVIGATAYILVKTSEGKAYPLIYLFYWAPAAKTWFPCSLGVGYVGSRKMDPVF